MWLENIFFDPISMNYCFVEIYRIISQRSMPDSSASMVNGGATSATVSLRSTTNPVTDSKDNTSCCP